MESTEDKAAAFARREAELEARVTRALEDGDQAALCALGWHLVVIEPGRSYYIRSGGWGPGASWLVGQAPFRSQCRKIQKHGAKDGVPWFDPCSACGAVIPGKVGG